MGNFAVLLERLPRDQPGTLKLLEMIAFLNNADHSLSYKQFLSWRRHWLPELRAEGPDYEIFAGGLVGQSEYLAELENVSIGTRYISTSF